MLIEKQEHEETSFLTNLNAMPPPLEALFPCKIQLPSKEIVDVPDKHIPPPNKAAKFSSGNFQIYYSKVKSNQTNNQGFTYRI
jgi:hypothetical protein